ncbi:MAG: hypothetical protein J5714_04260 [Alphaproteobacteria bacterium]|nr:hypothetical protein [Alphaproteobacteria bacterium]
MKKLLISFSLILFGIGIVYGVHADDKETVTSLKYVNDALATKQDEIGAQSGTKAVTYTDERGVISAREVKSNLGTNTSDTSLPMVGGVNTKLATKQDEIPAKNTNTVLTYTGVAGMVGEKGIYQDTGTYAAQSENLIDAGTFNAALKNGLDNEFVCAGYATTGECWLWSVDNTSSNTTQESYVSAVGTGYQDGTPTPTNPIYPVFYKQGDMILRRVGDYADSYDATTHKITRNVGVKVFKGTENWVASGPGWYTSIRDKEPRKIEISCTHYPYSSATMANAPDKSIVSFSSVNMGFKDSAFTTAADVAAFCLQQYNAGTPVTVYYPLATPVEEDWNETTYNENIYVPQNQQ